MKRASSKAKNPGLSLKLKQKSLFKKFRANPRLWIERCLKIIDKKGNEIPFVLNNIQSQYLDTLMELYWKPYKTTDSGEVIYRFQGIREVNLKARQFGLSTLICAILMFDSIFFKNTKSYIFCQDAPKSKEMLRDKIKFYWENMPQDPLLVLPRTTVYNESTVKFNTGSQIQCHTPGSSEGSARKAGRSITLRNGLLSEMAEWIDAETLWQGLGPALQDQSTNVFIESSPYPKKSGPFFRSLYEEGKTKNGIWNSRFWAWWMFDAYQMPFESDEEREAFQESITDIELVERELYSLTDEQLNWRRYMVSFLGGGEKGERRFRADFPANEKEGFEISSDNLFFCEADREIRLVLAEPQEPVEDRMYVIVADPAKGKLKTGMPSDDKKLGDKMVIHVWDPVTRCQVFRWSSQTYSIRKLHRKIYEIFCKYPGLVLIEENGLGQTVVALARLIKDLYFQKMMYWHSRTIDGWHTGSHRETHLVELREEMELAARVYGDLGEDDPRPDVAVGMRFSYQETVDEMDHFIDEGDGHPEASPGHHDDDIMTASIANQGMKVAAKYLKRHKKYYPDRELYRKEAHDYIRQEVENDEE